MDMPMLACAGQALILGILCVAKLLVNGCTFVLAARSRQSASDSDCIGTASNR